MPFLPSTDFATIIDGLEPVTLRRRRTDADPAEARIACALRTTVKTHELAAGGGKYTASDAVWHLPAAELSEPPALGDLLCDGAGRRWAVLEVARTTLGTRWRCIARIVLDLEDLTD
jgi:hypothetical protein